MRQAIDRNFRQKDGSGLSRMNVISPHSMVQLLQGMEKHPAKAAVHLLLSLAGVEGTLADRMKGTPAEKNVRAKWGEMVGVSGMVGTVTTGNGEKTRLCHYDQWSEGECCCSRADRPDCRRHGYLSRFAHPRMNCLHQKSILFPRKSILCLGTTGTGECLLG